jgi:hypothetical protein
VRRRRRDLAERLKLDPSPRSPGRDLVEEGQLELVLVHARELGGLLLRGDVPFGNVPVHGEDEAGVAALELDRGVVCLHNRLVCIEPIEHPTDRRQAVRRSSRIDRTRDDEAVDCPRQRDVVQTEPLGALLFSLGLANLLEAEDRVSFTLRRVHHPEPEPTVRQGEDLVRPARPADIATCVGDDHDLELEALRSVNGQQANSAAALLLRHCLQLLRAERVLLAHETDEAGDVRPADRLVVAGESSELAHVREPSSAVPAREHGEVVVVLGDDPLAQRLEADTCGRTNEPLVPLEKRAQESLVALVEVLRERTLERREERAARRVPS